MKIVFFSCLLFLFHAVFCLAQDTDTLPDYYNPEKAALYAGSKADNNGTYKLIDPEKTSFGVDAGGSAGVWKGGSMTGTFVAPHLNYRISPRFSAGLGGMLVNSTFTNAGIYQPGEGISH
ncbi:MAG: hypothetical protein KJ607_08740 [Bacteroidetes bacterium]|nr:hypothetical protein [Bacteroidota bacterium]